MTSLFLGSLSGPFLYEEVRYDPDKSGIKTNDIPGRNKGC